MNLPIDENIGENAEPCIYRQSEEDDHSKDGKSDSLNAEKEDIQEMEKKLSSLDLNQHEKLMDGDQNATESKVSKSLREFVVMVRRKKNEG